MSRGEIYDVTGQFDKAIEDYSQAIAHKPDYVDAIMNRGADYSRSGDTEHALMDDQAALKLAPTNPWTSNNLCYDLAIKGDAAAALPHCEKALELAPNEPAILDSRGYTYLRMQNYQHAIDDYNAVLKQNATLAASLFGRAIAYAALGKNDLAKADLAAARATDPAIDKEMAVIHLTSPAGL